MRARVLLALVGGGAFVVAWIVAVVILSDHVMDAGMAAQLAYFAAAGSVWVVPIGWLMRRMARSA